MKRLFAAILIILCLFSLASCAGKQQEEIVTTDFNAEGLPLTVVITFPEGYTVKQIAELLEENYVCTAQKFIDLTNNASYLKTLDYTFLKQIPGYRNRPFMLEGYIFPDTYEFYTNEGAEDALSRFLDNTEQRLSAEYKAQAEAIGYTMDQILSLASIIQEEAGDPVLMGNISSVLHNRLENDAFGILQCDATINYINDCVKDSPYISANVRKASENYNTYKRYGLPLGPICNPGTHAIEAALYPPETDYYFFASDDEGNYYYAETFEEHEVNCEIAGIY